MGVTHHSPAARFPCTQTGVDETLRAKPDRRREGRPEQPCKKRVPLGVNPQGGHSIRTTSAFVLVKGEPARARVGSAGLRQSRRESWPQDLPGGWPVP